jgi:shikimate kinase/uncharacterized protein YjbI with pentapeptide repeats
MGNPKVVGRQGRLAPLGRRGYLWRGLVAVGTGAIVWSAMWLWGANRVSCAAGAVAVSGRAEAVQAGLAAVGAVVALLVTLRRQRATEFGLGLQYDDLAQKEQDAVERRITELFTKAVEQTGSDKAPVRLGGLYSLERIAQDHEQHRQTIVEVICAYLRAPYPDPGKEASKVTVAQEQEERHVRLAALSILVRHLKPEAEVEADFWPKIQLELSGAVLLEANFGGCRIAAADFRGAWFIGPTRFEGANFDSRAQFAGAKFEGETTSFREVEFTGSADFTDAEFRGDAEFSGAQFLEAASQDMAQFSGVRFHGMAVFTKTVFGEYARFGGTEFRQRTWFSNAKFGTAGFGQAVFKNAVGFNEAEFAGYARFDRAVFEAGTLFRATKFAEDAWFNAVQFDGTADFRKAKFDALCWFGCSEFRQDAVFDSAEFGGTVRFHNALFYRKAGFDRNFPADASFDGAAFLGTSRSATVKPPSTEGILDLLPVAPRRVFLVGLMGSGKTTVGTDLAEILGWKYLDNDLLLKELTGFDAPELVRKVGKEGLWAEESRQLQDLQRRPAPFIAGVAASVGDHDDELRAMAGAGYIIYLDTQPETLAKRVGTGEGRPLLKDKNPKEFFQEQTDQRDANYRTADHIVATDNRDPRALAQELAEHLAALDATPH